MSVQAYPHLPASWNELWQTHEQVPWQSLQQLAEAAAADDRVVDDLFLAFHEQSPDDPKHLYFSQLYVSAIFALAAPRLPAPTRTRVAEFLLEELMSAGEDEDDFREDVLLAAAGTLGPEAVLPAILKVMPEDVSPPETVWSVWHLASLADKTSDTVLRERIVALAEEAVRRADAGVVEVEEVEDPAWVLARLGQVAARPLLQRLYDKTRSLEIKEDLDLLDGKDEMAEFYKPWEQPVQEWATDS